MPTYPRILLAGLWIRCWHPGYVVDCKQNSSSAREMKRGQAPPAAATYPRILWAGLWITCAHPAYVIDYKTDFASDALLITLVRHPQYLVQCNPLHFFSAAIATGIHVICASKYFPTLPPAHNVVSDLPEPAVGKHTGTTLLSHAPLAIAGERHSAVTQAD
ncbi:hypothetical protein [Herbaspirillum autotrophicum]|uniref:hypothetical protein n=1 Tax=Herbaspirillum autotrophicum TaxID=180195 RepID=UPI0012EEB296|nr:hypothetical protein [Herbaspirillum autotrophicum]